MKNINTQKGATSVIIVFILIVVISSMLGAALTSSRSGLSSANSQNNAAQATYLAESALERVVYNLNMNASCTGLVTPDQQTLNNGTFEISSSTISTTDAVECNIKVKGVMNGIVRYINTKVFNNGGPGGGGGGASYAETFPGPTLSPWGPEINTNNRGQSYWDTNNCNATCPGTAGTGSFYAESTGGGFFSNRVFAGYRETTISPINTGASGLTLGTTGGFRKASSGTAPNTQDISVELIDTGGGTVVLWTDTTTATVNWTAFSTSISLPPNTSYDKLRIRYNISGYSFNFWGAVENMPYVWLDEINLSASGGGTAPDWQVVEWQEVSQ